MNLVRSVISLFLLILLGLCIAGWVWAGGQPSPKMEGARFVLALSGLGAVGCGVLLWSTRQPQPL